MKNNFQSPAKLNLFLDILGKNQKSYHDLFALFCYVDLYDEICIKNISEPKLEIICASDFPLPADFYSANILHKAYNWYRTKVNPNINYGVSITIEKHIALGGGLGGGSSNAAILLAYLAAADGVVFSEVQLKEIAYEVGADVVFFLIGKSCYLGKIGEEKIAEVNFPKIPLIIVNPQINISTANIFANLTKYSGGHDLSAGLKVKFTTILELIDFLTSRKNDLEEVALKQNPDLQIFAQKLRRLLSGNFCRMTGSGASYFCLFKNEQERDLYAEKIKEQFPKSFIHIGFCYEQIEL